MQLATAANNRPYLCTLHYYSDNNLNFYWCSLLTRRHSKEIEQNKQVSSYVLVHENTPNEDYVIGITILGTAELIGADIDPKIVSSYNEKLDKDPDFVKDVISGKSPHKFYRLKPQQIVLFDNKNFPDNPRQEWKLG